MNSLHQKIRNHTLVTTPYTKGKHKGKWPAGDNFRRREYNIQHMADGSYTVNYGYNKYRYESVDPVTNNGRNWRRVNEGYKEYPLITAYPDGRVQFHVSSHYDTPLKLTADALYKFDVGLRLYRTSVKGVATSVLSVRGKRYRYYEGLILGADGALLTDPLPFEQRIADRSKTRAFTEAVKASGFKDMFKVLYASVPEPDPNTFYFHKRVVDPDDLIETRPQAWTAIITAYKYERNYKWDGNGGTGRYVIEESGTAASCWSRIMSAAKRHMTCRVDSDAVSLES